ncbi:phosphotransferase family protein [Paenibacillus hodogayensis]|uniref:Phosphotransferase family protein n=1 Tax=Paenibacillus hodogayensis TaxID=279208 RepID=A0ABV5VSX5_9BACL
MVDLKKEKLVAHLRAKYPELAAETFRIVDSGRQNLIIVVGERIVFRFPLTSDLSSLRLEQRILPQLAERLPLPIPKLLYSSEPAEPAVYVGYPLVPGQSLEGGKLAALDERTQEALARQIAGFLTALHLFDDDPITRVDTGSFQTSWRKNWGGYYRSLETLLFPRIGRREQLWIMEVFYRYLYPPGHFEFRPCLIHGDFKNDHILYDPAAGKLTGIIDFGQLKMGDPAYDYHDLCITYGEPFSRAVLRYYKGPSDPTFLSRCMTFYANLLKFSSMMGAVQNNDWVKFNNRLEWLKKQAKDARK